jgi:hypothetical protein
MMRPSSLWPLLGIFLVACASKPVSTADMKHPPDKRIISSAMFQPQAGTLPVVIKRDSEANLMPCMVRISVDGVPLVDLAPKEGVTLHVQEGERFLSAHLCPGIGGGEIRELMVRVGEGEHSTYRISGTGAGSGINFQPTMY